MRITEKNKPIGTCQCPMNACNETMQVFKFRGRENVLQRRLAGKFYGNCPAHGRIGSDGKQSTIDYIADNMTWLQKSDEQSTDAAPEKAAEKPQNLPIKVDTGLPVITAEKTRSNDLWNL
jgi:hypothetical protein